jgi:hypothetical protein
MLANHGFSCLSEIHLSATLLEYDAKKAVIRGKQSHSCWKSNARGQRTNVTGVAVRYPLFVKAGFHYIKLI